MKKAIEWAMLVFLVFALPTCSQEGEFNFYGKWQSLNDPGFVIELAENGNYSLFRNGKSMFENVDDYGQLKIQIKKKKKDWCIFKIVGDNNQKEFGRGRFEIVTKDRIRMYAHKHHDILDLADEFYRTEDLNSFDAIMEKIMATPYEEK